MPYDFSSATAPGTTGTHVITAPTSAAATPPSAPSPATAYRGPRDWRRRYASLLRLTDLLVLIWVVYGTQIAWFGFGNAQVAIREDSRITDISYWLFSGGLVAVWMWTLSLADTRDHRIIGAGAEEYARIARSSLSLFGVIAIQKNTRDAIAADKAEQSNKRSND